jgi:hypothetical protein
MAKKQKPDIEALLKMLIEFVMKQPEFQRKKEIQRALGEYLEAGK